MVTGGWITQADRSRWQQRAAAELAAERLLAQLLRGLGIAQQYLPYKP